MVRCEAAFERSALVRKFHRWIGWPAFLSQIVDPRKDRATRLHEFASIGNSSDPVAFFVPAISLALGVGLIGSAPARQSSWTTETVKDES